MAMDNSWMTTDVLVIGAGNAAACAALAARDAGANVVMIEAASQNERGGNSAYTGGAMRVAYAGIDDLTTLMDLTADDRQRMNFGSYPADDFFDDLCRVTHYRTDAALADTLINHSLATLQWMRTQHVRFQPSLRRQAFEVDGVYTFWGGLACEVSGGGRGLVDALLGTVERKGIALHYHTRAMALTRDDDGGITGVNVLADGKPRHVNARSVVLACGGFESNAEMRARYLGRNWDLAKVRGTRFNMGDGLRMALAIGAAPCGHFSGAHAVAWDRNAPPFGDLAIADGFQKHSYPFGLIVNADGRRFVDEGADFRNYTYAAYGGRILEQPGMFAWQVFDAKVAHLLRDEYRIRQVTKASGETLEELASRMEGVDAGGFLATVAEYNAAVRTNVPFNPNIKDGRGTRGLALPKSNWANTLDTPPFEAFAVTCGVTFTFGGLKVDTSARVLDASDQPIPGLFAAGEMVGGLFYHNYPGGTGLTSGAVFGKLAGEGAATFLGMP